MNHAEEVLFAHLTEVDSLEVLSREGFHQQVSREVIPTELGRKLVAWTLEYFWANGRKVAPSKEAILSTWGDDLEQMEIVIGDDTETDSIEWAIDELRAQYATWRSQDFVKKFATSVATADNPDKVAAILEGAGELYALSQAMVSRRHETTLDLGLEDALLRHEQRRASGHTISGMTLGLPEIDAHSMGVHPGEMAVFAGFSGAGKSWLAAKTLLAEWDSGRKAVLCTMENDLPMTLDRLACIKARVPYDKWQLGQAGEGDVIRVREVLEQIRQSEHLPIIVMPNLGERDPQSIVRHALGVGADSLIIDQLSYVERVPGSRTRERPQMIAEMLRLLKSLINEGRDQIPCLLLHQINRDGHAAARKTGRYAMEHLADSSECERAADHVWAVYQSEDDQATSRAVWQILKMRRGVFPKAWDMRWRLGLGDIRVLNEVNLA